MLELIKQLSDGSNILIFEDAIYITNNRDRLGVIIPIKLWDEFKKKTENLIERYKETGKLSDRIAKAPAPKHEED